MDQNQNKGPNNEGPKNKQSLLILLICIMVVLVCVNMLTRMTGGASNEIPYSDFIEMLENGEVESVVIQSSSLEITPRVQHSMGIQSTFYTVPTEDGNEVTKRLEAAGVDFKESRILWDSFCTGF